HRARELVADSVRVRKTDRLQGPVQVTCESAERRFVRVATESGLGINLHRSDYLLGVRLGPDSLTVQVSIQCFHSGSDSRKMPEDVQARAAVADYLSHFVLGQRKGRSLRIDVVVG